MSSDDDSDWQEGSTGTGGGGGGDDDDSDWEESATSHKTTTTNDKRVEGGRRRSASDKPKRKRAEDDADWDRGEGGDESQEGTTQKARKKDERVKGKKASGGSRKKERSKSGGTGAGGVESKQLRQWKKKAPQITVGLTGARAGDTLHGCEGDTENVVLRVEGGVVAAPRGLREAAEGAVGRERLVADLAKQYGLSASAAAMRYEDCPVAEQPNHQPLGQSCTHDFRWSGGCGCEPAARFTILNQGVWQSFAEENGNGDQLKAMVREGISLCYRDVLLLMQTKGAPGGKTLILRPKLFKIVTGPVALAENDPRLQGDNPDVIDASAFAQWGSNKKTVIDTSVFEMDGRLFRLPISAKCRLTKDEICPLVVGSLTGLVQDDVLKTENVQLCLEILAPLTAGGLKSLLQKTIRFRAVTVDMGQSRMGERGHQIFMSTPLVAATAIGLLFIGAGSFSPELQLYTRGCTSALKRLAVVLVEDGWVENAEEVLLSLMVLARATQLMPDYHPSICIIRSTMQLAAKATDSPLKIAWQEGSTVQHARTVKIKRARANSIKFASDLLKMVRSFQGDMDMFQRVADIVSRTGRLKLSRASDSERTGVMPLCHCVDQHTYRGIAHVGPSTGRSFAERFKLIFDRTTGFNPRQSSPVGFEDSKVVRETRFAQLCCSRFAFKVPRSVIPKTACGDIIELKLGLDSGTLAAAVGPIPVKIKGSDGRKREVLVMLGVRCPEDEIVMLKPARTTRDLFGTITESERADAISQAREKKLSADSPLLPGAHKVAYDGCWRLDGKPWECVASAGRVLSVPLVKSPSWIEGDAFSSVLQSDDALMDAMKTTCDTGVVPDAERLVEALVENCSNPVALRAVSMLRQQYTKVSLPVPSLSGGLGSDQLAAYRGDWDVFRLLALVARLAPGALRPEMPPNFTVVNATLLRIVERWMLNGMRPSAGAGDICSVERVEDSDKRWMDHSLWQGMADAESRLMEHQRCAVASMIRRDSEADTGHFLIMDTGVGKTVTSLWYLYRWLVKNGGTAIRRILWITPKGTVANLVKQLKGTWSAPVWTVPRLSTAKKPNLGDSRRLILKDYYVNVIHADHLRGMIDAGLAEQAPSSCIVFDEVDEMYAPTLRTSAARRLAQLCPKFVAQTATPMRKNESQLLAWLSDTCSFPVNSKNILVAASGMVSIQLELGIASEEQLVLVPMQDKVRSRVRELLVDRRWLPMAQLVQEHTDVAMVKEAVERSIQDRRTYSNGGVLLVADTKEHARKLLSMCDAHGNVRAGDFDTLDAPNASSFGIVVVTKDKDRGYNSACRLGSMVTGVYAGNGASRHQMRGRLRRLGQKRKKVIFTTVTMENSLLHLLHIRHDAVDSMNITLQELGDKFSADVLKALNKQ